MKEVMAVVSAVRRRLFANLIIDHFLWATFLVAAVIAAAVLTAKIVFFPKAFGYITYGAIVGFAAACAYATAAARTKFFAAAIAADEGLGLAERLSTAIAVAKDEAPFAQAVVEDARRMAAGARAAARFPISVPSGWWRPALSLAVLAAVLAMPQLDPFGRLAEFKRQQKDKQEAISEVKRLQKEAADLKKLVGDKDSKALEAINDLELKLAELEKMNPSKKDMLAAVSGPLDKLAERMKQIAQGLAKDAQSKKFELAKAEQAKALSDAKAQLENLKEALQKGELSQAERDKLAKALEDMSKQLSQSGGQNAETAQQMAKAAESLKSGDSSQALQSLQQAVASMNTSLAGLNPFMASNKNAGQPLLDSSQSSLSGTSGQMVANSAGEIQALADAMKGMGEYKDNLGAGESMSMAEAMAQLESAAAMWAQSGYGSMPGDEWGMGEGMKGPGVGKGGHWPVGEDAGSKMQSSTVSGAMHPGRMLASYYTEGGTIKNESKVQLQEVVLEGKQRAKEALTDQKVPRAYEKIVRDYFESLDVPK